MDFDLGIGQVSKKLGNTYQVGLSEKLNDKKKTKETIGNVFIKLISAHSIQKYNIRVSSQLATGMNGDKQKDTITQILEVYFLQFIIQKQTFIIVQHYYII